MSVRRYSRKTNISSYFITFAKLTSVEIKELNVEGGKRIQLADISELDIGKEVMKKVAKGDIMEIDLTTLKCSRKHIYVNTYDL